jgi:hypothetical protein
LGSPAKKAPSGPYADKLWREALRRAVLKRVEGEQRLDRIAERVVSAAENGDDKAYREIGDRLDGKPAQAIVGGGEGDEPIRVINEIRRVIVDPGKAA